MIVTISIAIQSIIYYINRSRKAEAGKMAGLYMYITLYIFTIGKIKFYN